MVLALPACHRRLITVFPKARLSCAQQQDSKHRSVVTQAAELFEVENSTSEANKCRLKIAQYSAELERFPVAIEIYENIAKSQVDNNLLKYSAKGNLLNAGLCRLNGEHFPMSMHVLWGCFLDLCMLGITIEQIAIHEHRPMHEHCH